MAARNSRSDLVGWGSSRASRVDLTDTTAFPELGGVADDLANAGCSTSIYPLKLLDNVTEPDDYVAPARPWYILDESESDSDTKVDTILPGWILLTSADARKPILKTIVDLGTESDDDEDTMPMTTAKSRPTPKNITEPVTEWTTAELLELFRIDVARHDREVADRENDICDDYLDEDELEWLQRTDAYFGGLDEYTHEEDGEDEDEYEYE